MYHRNCFNLHKPHFTLIHRASVARSQSKKGYEHWWPGSELSEPLCHPLTPEVLKRCPRRMERGRGLSFSIVGGTSSSDEFRWSRTPARTDSQNPLPHNSRFHWGKVTFLTAWVLTWPLGMLPMQFFFLIKIQLIYNLQLCQSLLYRKVTQLYTHTHTHIYIYILF